MTADNLPFGDPQGISSPAQPVSPPVPYLVLASVALLGSAALLLAGGYADLAHITGWLLASVLAIGAVAVFTAEDLKRRQLPNYAPQRLAGRMRWILAVTALFLSGLHAWTLAWSWAAR